MSLYPSSEQDQIAYWEREIAYCLQYYKPWFNASQYLLDQYNLDEATFQEQAKVQYAGSGSDPTQRVKSNLVFGWIDQSVANAAANYPQFRVTPHNERAIGRQNSVAEISNFWYKSAGQLKQDKRTLLDAHLCPYAGGKLGWWADANQEAHQIISADPEFVEDDPEHENIMLITGLEMQVTDSQNHAHHIAEHVAALQDPELDPVAQLRIQHHIDWHKHMEERGTPTHSSNDQWESPFYTRWQPGDFLIDPLAQNGLTDARYVMFRWRRPLYEVQATPFFQNVIDLEPQSAHRLAGAPNKDRNLLGMSTKLPDQFDVVEGWDIYARNFPKTAHRRVDLDLTIVPGHSKMLRRYDEWPYDTLQDYPAELLQLTLGIKSWHNHAPLLLAGGSSIQGLTNEILDSYLHIIRRTKNIFLYDPQYMEEDDIFDVLGADDMTAHPVDGLADAGNKAFVPVQFGDVPPEKGELVRIIHGLLDRSAGTPQPVSSVNPDSATEARNIDDRTSARENDRNAAFFAFQERKATKFWQLTAEFKPKRMFLIDPRNAPDVQRAIQVDDEIAAGQFGFEIEITSEANARSVERKQGMDLLNLVAGLAPLFQQKYGDIPNIAVILERLLRKGFDEHDIDTIMPFLKAAKDQTANGEITPDIAAQMAGQAPARADVQATQQAVNQGAAAGPVQQQAFNANAARASNIQGAGNSPANSGAP